MPGEDLRLRDEEVISQEEYDLLSKVGSTNASSKVDQDS